MNANVWKWQLATLKSQVPHCPRRCFKIIHINLHHKAEFHMLRQDVWFPTPIRGGKNKIKKEEQYLRQKYTRSETNTFGTRENAPKTKHAWMSLVHDRSFHSILTTKRWQMGRVKWDLVVSVWWRSLYDNRPSLNPQTLQAVRSP